ncbi:hypothetical protein C2G38_2282038 [Gigaspora rosea]|uniref:Uncharacterized protein n=1 Tax=Gigaspora rosea TaxID=44941 RepID=A0A397U5S7_9GLOM|nr:hypothetical protein C2G38_2282038 [Gigaspora rosea]
MVLVQDENEVQEVLPATLTLESGEGYDVEESSHQRLKSTLELLPVETLKLLYNSEGFEKRSNVNEGDAKTQDWENSDLQFLALERSLEKSIQASLEKAVDEIRKSIKNWEMIGKVRDVAATRAFTLRVAKREGWNVVAGIRDPLDDDPMEVFFQEKLASARQSTRNNHPRWDRESEMSDVFFPNGPEEMGGMALNPMVHWSMTGQQYFQQPGQPGFVPGGIPTYGSMLPYPSAYQHRYENY